MASSPIEIRITQCNDPEEDPEEGETKGETKENQDEKPCSSNTLDDYDFSDNLLIGNNIKTSTPLPTVSMVDLQGREVIFAILLFLFVSISLGMAYIIAESRMKSATMKDKLDNATQDLELCYNKPLDTCTCSETLCLSKECLKASANMMANMRPEVNPCKDFWQYACGGWLESHEIPPTRESWAVDDILEQVTERELKSLLEQPIQRNGPESSERKMKTMYSKCMDVDAIEKLGVQPLRDAMTSMGGWAVTNRTPNWDFSHALEELHFKYWLDVLFSMWTGPVPNKSNEFVIQMQQGGLGLDMLMQYELNETDPQVAPYMTYMQTVARLYGATKDQALQFARSTFEFEGKLAGLQDALTFEQLTDLPSAMHNVSIEELERMSPKIRWKAFFKRGFNVPPSTRILVHKPEYFQQLSDLIADTDPRDLNMYMMWRLSMEYTKLLSKDFRKARHTFNSVTAGATKAKDRWQTCMAVVGEWFKMGLGAMFVKSYADVNSKQEVTAMIKDIQLTFYDILRQNTWMSNDTSKAAMKKLAAIKYQLSHPDFILNESKVDELYHELDVGENDTFFQLHLEGVSEGVRWMVEAISPAIHKEDVWDVTIHKVNAYYSYAENKMVFPAGLLQSPYYSAGVPKYINYASLGSTIAHEMIHGFDTNGMKYDKNGNKGNWSSTSSLAAFNDRTQCVVDYYSTLSYQDHKINGNLTLAENLADIAGLKTAYQSYKVWESQQIEKEKALPGLDLTNEQAFFLAYAQNWCGKRRPEGLEQFFKFSQHAPGEIRVRGALAQVPAFAAAYGCPAGGTMHPRDTCVIW